MAGGAVMSMGEIVGWGGAPIVGGDGGVLAVMIVIVGVKTDYGDRAS